MFNTNPVTIDAAYIRKIEALETARINKKLCEYLQKKGYNGVTNVRDVDNLLLEIKMDEEFNYFKTGIEVRSNKETFDKFNQKKKDFSDKLKEKHKSFVPTYKIPTLNSGKSSSKLLLSLEVKLEGNVTDTIRCYSDDNPSVVTENFCMKHHLGEESKQKIFSLIEQRIKNL